VGLENNNHIMLIGFCWEKKWVWSVQWNSFDKDHFIANIEF